MLHFRVVLDVIAVEIGFNSRDEEIYVTLIQINCILTFLCIGYGPVFVYFSFVFSEITNYRLL